MEKMRFTTFAIIAGFIGLGCFDTVEAQSLTLSSTNLTFTVPQGGNSANTQSVTVGSTGGNVSFTISTTATWLSASTGPFNGSGGTSGETLTVAVNPVSPTSLASGNYSGTITLTPTNGSAAAVITVALTVTGSGTTTSTISASPSQLSFGFELHQAAPPSQTTQITSSGISLPISFGINVAPTSNCPAGWLQASLSSSSTPSTLTI